MSIILTHVARNNRQRQLTFYDEHEARLMAYRMRHSPKTKAVTISYNSPLASAQWGTDPIRLTHDGTGPRPGALSRAWNYLTEHCRWRFR